jgi:hypothetical protein
MAPSIFFRLPRELRVGVYKYALHHADGILYRVSKSGIGKLYANDQYSNHKRRFTRLRSYSSGMVLKKWRSTGPVCNQLEYVCRRLRDETQGLSMHYNMIHIQDSATTNSIEQCTTLPRFQRCAERRQVAINCRTMAREFSKENIAAMIRHCAVHADVLVRMHVPYWCQADPDLANRGLSYVWQLRTRNSYSNQKDIAELSFLLGGRWVQSSALRASLS